MSDETPKNNSSSESGAATPIAPPNSSLVNTPQNGSPTTQTAYFYNPEKEIERLNGYFIAVVVVVVISFLIEIYTMNADRIKDKDLYLRYNDLYQQYSGQNSELKDKINSQNIEINNLRNEIELIYAKNTDLKQ